MGRYRILKQLGVFLVVAALAVPQGAFADPPGLVSRVIDLEESADTTDREQAIQDARLDALESASSRGFAIVIVDANGKVVGPVATFSFPFLFFIFIPELSSKPFVGTASTQEVEIPGGTGLIFPTPDYSGDPMGSTGPTPEAMHAIGFVKDRRDGQFLQLGTPVPEPVVIRSALDLNDPNVPVCEPRNQPFPKQFFFEPTGVFESDVFGGFSPPFSLEFR